MRGPDRKSALSVGDKSPRPPPTTLRRRLLVAFPPTTLFEMSSYRQFPFPTLILPHPNAPMGMPAISPDSDAAAAALVSLRLQQLVGSLDPALAAAALSGLQFGNMSMCFPPKVAVDGIARPKPLAIAPPPPFVASSPVVSISPKTPPSPAADFRRIESLIVRSPLVETQRHNSAPLPTTAEPRAIRRRSGGSRDSPPEADHRCHVCNKLFKRQWLLQGHLRTHTGERPFKCLKCHKAFADKSNLRAHVQTHSGTKNHVCERCGKRFALKSYLSKHAESSCNPRSRPPAHTALPFPHSLGAGIVPGLCFQQFAHR